jgi:hypothetical protein
VPLAPPTRYRICLSLLCLPSFDFELPPIAFSSLLSRRQKPVSDRYPADQSRATEIRDDGNVRRSDLCQLWPIEVHGDCADRQPLVWLSTPPYTRKTLSLRGWSHHNRADAWVPVRQVKVSGTVSESEYTGLSQFSYRAVLLLCGVRCMTVSPAQFFRQFFYRFNSNGTMDSICSLCFRTVATVANDAELHNFEAAHHCQGG